MQISIPPPRQPPPPSAVCLVVAAMLVNSVLQTRQKVYHKGTTWVLLASQAHDALHAYHVVKKRLTRPLKYITISSEPSLEAPKMRSTNTMGTCQSAAATQ